MNDLLSGGAMLTLELAGGGSLRQLLKSGERELPWPLRVWLLLGRCHGSGDESQGDQTGQGDQAGDIYAAGYGAGFTIRWPITTSTSNSTGSKNFIWANPANCRLATRKRRKWRKKCTI